MCEQKFTPEQEDIIIDVLETKQSELFKLVKHAILECEKSSDEEFSRNNIVFTEHSAANSDYLCYAVICELFAGLHRGDKGAAVHAITGMLGQAGLLDEDHILIEEYRASWRSALDRHSE